MKYFHSLSAGLILLLMNGGGWAAAININTATAEQLAEAMEGVGPNKAGAIVLYREQHGPFNRVEDLTRVRGIGKTTIELNRGVIAVTDRPGPEGAGPAVR